MLPSVTHRCFLVLMVAMSLAWFVPAVKGQDADRPFWLATRLRQPIKFEGYDDPKTTLQEALHDLSQKYELNFDINERAFKDEGLADVASTPIGEKAIPKMHGARLDTVLNKILAKVAVPSGTTYMVRSDRIEITTGTFQRAEIWGGEERGPFLPLVHTVISEKPLEQALMELAADFGFNIVLDTLPAGRAKTPVSARFLNVPLDTAVRLLADMADLKPIRLDNVLYVTTRETQLGCRKRKTLGARLLPQPYLRHLLQAFPRRSHPHDTVRPELQTQVPAGERKSFRRRACSASKLAG